MNKWMKYGLWVPVLSLMSCQNFLEPKSQSEYVPELVKSLDEMLLGEVYMGPGDGALTTILGFFDDDAAMRSHLGKYEDQDEKKIQQVQLAFTWSKDMINSLGGYDLYSQVYKRIVGCNAVMDYVDGVKGTEEQKNNVKAQALALRSYFYFHLVNLYGKPYSMDKNALGVPLKLTSDLASSGLSRNTVGEVYDQIVSDLLEAERLFKTLPREDWNKKDNRVNLPMIQLLLSRVYLYMENWSEVITCGERVMRDYNYALLDLNTIDEPNQFAESSYPNYFTWTNPETIFLFGDKMDRIDFPTKGLYVYDDGGRSSYSTIGVVSEELVNTYEDLDLRKKRYLVWESTNYGEKQPVYRILASKLPLGPYFSANNMWGEHWGISFRVAEAYLNVAEAASMMYKKTGDAQYMTKAWNTIDQLREKRFMASTFQPTSINNSDELITFVREERRRELCFENHRWFDLRRYGMNELKHVWYDRDGNVVEYILRKNDPGFTLLIPKEAFSVNPSLIQNEERGK